MEKDKEVVRPIENTLILCLRATQTEPYLAMCHICNVLNAKAGRIDDPLAAFVIISILDSSFHFYHGIEKFERSRI